MTWRATTATLPLGFPGITPAQVKGIEINAYAQQLAQAAIWIGYLQWLNANGFGWSEPVLAPLDSIEHKDALLAFHDDGAAAEAEWPDADFIIGNPPFLGNKRFRSKLGHAYTEQLYAVFGDRLPGTSDLCCYFFEKARAEIERQPALRAGLLATNSIRDGGSKRVLDRIKSTGDLFAAWSDEPWVLDGASVRISIVCFARDAATSPMLNGHPVATINSDLSGTLDLTRVTRLPENRRISFMGNKKHGPFEATEETAEQWMTLPLNPNGRPNSDVVRPWWNGLDVTRRPRSMWIVDFGSDMQENDAALYEAPFQHVLEHVKPERETNNRAIYRQRWWIHGESRPGLRAAIAPLQRYLATAQTAKYRLLVWLDRSILPDCQLIVFAREDDYFFGVLHSRGHEVWSLRMGTSLEDRPRYTPTTCFETFPLPWPPGQEPVDDPIVIAIGDAAKRLDELRNNWLNPEGASDIELKKRTLTNLYNARPTWLRNAHAALDRAVWDAYAWPADEVPAEVEEDVILSRLLELNQERVEK
jgi:type II restriction/modification system DNA methylase subunit YeeA